MGSNIGLRRGVLAAVVVALCGFATAPSSHAATELTDLQHLGASGGGRALLPAIARSGDVAYVVHFKEGDFGGFKVDRLGDGGTVQEHTAAVPCRTVCFPGYGIAADERSAFMAWEEFEPQGDGIFQTEVYASASDDRGETFSNPKVVSGSPGKTSWFPTITAAGDSAYVAWQESNGAIMVRRLTMDRVLHAHQAVEIVKSDRQGQFSIAATGGAVHIAWTDSTGVHLRTSRNAAQTFGPTLNLRASTRAYGTRVVATDTKAYVAWPEFATRETEQGIAQLATVETSGTAAVTTLGKTRTAYGDVPALDASAGHVYFAFEGQGGIYFGRDGEAARRIADLRPAGAPGLSANGRSVDVLWVAHRGTAFGDPEVQVASSEDAGSSFSILGGDNFRFPADEMSLAPALAAFEDGFSMAWMGVDGAINKGVFTIGHRGGKQGDPDLELKEIEPVQAARGVDKLAAGKPFAVRASIRSGLKRSSVRIQVQVQQGATLDTETVNVPLKFGVQDVWLALKDFRPEAGAPVRTRVIVDPDNRIGEPDEANNEIVREQAVLDTKRLELLYVPVRVDGRAPTCTEAGKVAAGARSFLLGAFPLDDRESLRAFTCGIPATANPALAPDRMLDELLRDLASRRWDAPDIDKVVGVVPDGFFKDHYAPAPTAIGISPLQQRDEIPAMLVEAGSAAGASPTLQGGQTLAHELAHNTGIDHRDAPAPGYWVQRARAFSDERDLMAPAAGDRWIAAQTFEQLLDGLRSAPAKLAAQDTGIAIAGRLDGPTLRTGAWFGVERAPDVQPGSTGQITAEYLDASNGVLATAGFDVEHTIHAAGTNAESTGSAFSVVLPNVADTRTLRLRRGSDVLAERTLSANAPTVTVDPPASPAPVGEPLSITWKSEDADGDTLRHNLALSRDGGATWVPVATDVAGQSFTFTPSPQDTTGRALVRVTVSDGFRTASGVSAQFAIRPGSGALAFSRGGRIMVMNEDGSGATPVSKGPDDVEPDWSPDGRRIAFTRDAEGLYVVGADGSGERRLYEGDVHDPSWTPDGTRIVFAEGTGAINSVPVAAGEADFVTLGEHPDVSPDGTRIAFNRGYKLHVANIDGTDARELAPPRALEPDWAPDGKTIIASGCGEHNAGLCLVDPADGATTPVDAPPAASGPTFASDGKRVAYAQAWSRPMSIGGTFGDEAQIAPLSADSAFGLVGSGTRVYRSELSNGAWTPGLEIERSTSSNGVGVAVNAHGEGVAAFGNQVLGCYRLAALERTASGVWSAPTPLSEPCVWSQIPSVGLADDGTAHVAWYDQSAWPYTVKVRSRVNGTWEPAVTLSQDSVASDGADLVTAPGGRTVALWVEQISGQPSRVIARVRESGGQWGAPQVLSTTSYSLGHEARVGTDAGGRFTFSWYDQGGLKARALDADGTWGAERTLCSGCLPGKAQLGVGADGTAAVTYDTDKAIYLRVRRGGEWGEPLKLSNNRGLFWPPGVDADGNVLVVYDEEAWPGSTVSRRVTAAGMEPAQIMGPTSLFWITSGTEWNGPRFTPDGAAWAVFKDGVATAVRWTPSRVGAINLDGTGEELFGPLAKREDIDPDFQRAPASAPPEDPEPAGPVAETGGPYTGVEGKDIALAAGAGAASYAWDLDGDGAYDDADGREPTARFGDEGTFPIGLRVTDADGVVATAATTATVEDAEVTLSEVRAARRDDGTAVLDARLTDPGAEDAHVATVDWGDGTGPQPATLVREDGGWSAHATHTYTTPGPFEATLHVDTVFATVEVEALAADRAPVAAGSAVSTAHATPVQIALDGSDPDGERVAAELVTLPAFGTVAFAAGEPLAGEPGTIVYTPQAGFSGTDTFTWRARSGTLRSESVTVSVFVGPAPEPSSPVEPPVGSPGTVITAPPVTVPPIVVAEPRPEPPTAGEVAAAIDRAAAADPALAEQVIVIPPAKQCVSRRTLKLKFFGKRGVKLTRATVKIATRKPLVLRGARLKPTVDLRGLPKGTFKVRVDAVTTTGKTLTVSRKYRTCAPRKGGRK